MGRGESQAAGSADGRRRVAVESVWPEVDCGRFPAKRIAGETVTVEADAFTDGHDAIRCVLLHRKEDESGWSESDMEPLGNDRWRGSFPAEGLGLHRFTVEAWVDDFETWRRDFEKRREAGQGLAVPLEVGARLVEAAAARAAAAGETADAAAMEERAAGLRAAATEPDPAPAGPAGSDDSDSDAAEPAPDHPALDPELADRVARHPDRAHATRYARELRIWADRPRARFGAWYEFFPRSTGPAGEHGTFETAAEFLPYVAEMGFDVVYLPPIHPIGTTFRKGANNAVTAEPGEPGSPWAIGAAEGGHTAIHPELGTLEEFRAFRERAEALGLEVALDVAFQTSPDHPWVEAHPEWFRHRPDGTIQYAENPPKKYQDIYPLHFEGEEWSELWDALEGVFRFWIEQGVRIFRVDNPHTKPFAFWEAAIGSIRADHPDTIFLAEAFTRPRVMYRLAKLGFTQSYTYFAWRDHKAELEAYARELATPPVSDFFRPAFWPNTPDILTERLQTGGRGAFMARLVLAAALSPTYGIYGPAYELMESAPREPGSEEYLNSEKYQIRDWDLKRSDSLRHFIGRVNRIRRDHPALHHSGNVTFHPTDNDRLIAWSRRSPDGRDVVLAVVNLDPHHVQTGWVELDLPALGLEPDEPFQAHDMLGGSRYLWRGSRNYVELNPGVVPAHLIRPVRRARTERDFEYFL